MRLHTHRKNGFTLVEIMIVVAIIGLLAAIAIPNFIRARETAQLNSILNNLRIIDSAKDMWVIEMRRATGAACELDDLTQFIKGGRITQVSKEIYAANAIGTDPTVDLGQSVLLGRTGVVTLSDLTSSP
jgi:prepilin-type N-terminal cleavage/methylation domain-containing protein